MSVDYRAQILQAVDLVDLVSQTVSLKRRGKDFIGLCPFHQEKTPSFHVSPARQYFRCYGCKAGGTAFDFIMLRDRVEFRDALEILARSAGIELPQFGGSKGEQPGERQALLDALSAACRFFRNLLSEPHAAVARDYLASRGFTRESLQRFQVGFAADSWDALLKGPVGRKFPPQLLASAGLIKPREQGDGFYDTFRGRIIFPIRNERGQIIAFGGRVLPGSNDPAKYLNSPETPLFSKSRCIFGLDLARQRIVETRTVAVVEGYTDVVMAHQFGASNVVSVLGTAMTEPHVAVLRRFADRIVLLFDADAAGDAAVSRVVQLFLSQPVEMAVASMPDGLDPDEFLLKHGTAAFDNLLAGAVDALEYAWLQMSRKFQAGGLTGQQRAVEEYLGLLASARSQGQVNDIRWGAALARVGRMLGIGPEDLQRRFAARKQRPRRLPTKTGGPAAREEPGSEALAERPLTGRDRAERWVLGVLLVHPRLWHQVQRDIELDDFLEPRLRALAQVIWDCQHDDGEPVFNEFLARLPDASGRALAIELVDEVEQLADLEETLRGAVEHLSDLRRKREEQSMMALARQARQVPLGEQGEVELLRRFAEERARQPDLRRAGS